MAKVKLLDEQLANQIAAGEVVERPASIVKELVENAIDAGSTTIDVTLEEGGLTFIRVLDNGDGIEHEDMLTAFERHATSKISMSSDLFKIASLGFRGEALPSIAAVAKVECTSATANEGLAHRIVIEGGKLISNEQYNAPRGTDMVVKDLFFNTPARLKYMKTIQTELGHISDYIYRIALAHPGVAFTLKHNGNVLLRTLGTGDRLQVIAAIYGSTTAKQMLAIEGHDSDYEILGYVSKPELNRSSRNGMTVIVNGRYIRSMAINSAIAQAYHTLLPINRFPLVVIEIQMHPALLDVNVHPSKMEVRFSKEQELKQLVENIVKEKLSSLRYIPGADSIARKDREKPSFIQDTISFHIDPKRDERDETNSANFASTSNTGHSGNTVNKTHTFNKTNYSDSTSQANSQFPDGMYGGSNKGRIDWSVEANKVIPADATERLYKKPELTSQQLSEFQGNSYHHRADVISSESSALKKDEPGQHQLFPELHWIGQHHGTYIVAQSVDGLYLIDQHAAHERINYEYYYEKFGEPIKASQQLIVPITLEFTPSEATSLIELLDYFEEAGIQIEPFGNQTFLVRAYPQWLPKGNEEAILLEMATYILEEKKKINLSKFREEAAIMCSCKASIKANDRLTREEGDGLLKRLAQCKQPFTCPHGRPIIVHFSTYDLEKMFKRVMT